MTEIAALNALVAQVQAFFQAVNPSVSVGTATFWKSRFEQLNQGKPAANRVLFFPCDEQGRGGSFKHGRQTSANPRDLLQLDGVTVVSVWAYDASAPTDDAKQLQAVDDLLQQVIQAITRAAAHGVGYPSRQAAAIHWGSKRWTVTNQEMVLGREVLIDLLLPCTYFDIPYSTVVPSPVVNRSPAT